MDDKPRVGARFAEVTAVSPQGASVTLGRPAGVWHMIVVYRGAHCPRCKTYLTKLAALLPQFEALGVHVMCVTSDPPERAAAFLDGNGIAVPWVAELPVGAMRALGLYVSDPRDASETDRQFPEPGLFVVNPDGILHVADISNSPAFRPDLDVVLNGLATTLQRGTPVRGLA